MLNESGLTSRLIMFTKFCETTEICTFIKWTVCKDD